MNFKKTLRWAFTILVTLIAGWSPALALTITDSQGVIYDIIGTTKTVIISGSNTGVAAFHETGKTLVIDAEVTDAAGSAGTNNDTYTVVGMAAKAFQNCTGLESIVINAPIPEVGTSTFDGCTGLRLVELPNSVEVIGDYAFQNCTALTSITGFSSLTRLGVNSFYNCETLTGIELPDGLTTMGSHVFDGCSSLKSLTFPEKVTSLPDYACYKCSSLETVTLPENLTTIGQYTFQHCASLKMPKLPAKVDYVWYSAFANCDNLGVVELTPATHFLKECFKGSYVSDIVFPSESLQLDAYCFSESYGMKKITLPEWARNSYDSFGSGVFSGMVDLEEVAMEEGSVEIGDYWFQDCKKLTTLTCASSVRKIGSSAFNGCVSLVNLILPDEMDMIYDAAFCDCSSLTSINIPKGVSLGKNAFNAKGLVEINFPDAPLGTVNGLTFNELPNVKSLYIPGNVGSLPNGLFYKFSGLESVEIGEGYTEISASLFASCPKISSVKLPSTLKKIGHSAFRSDSGSPSNLTSLTFPEGLEEIEACAFYNNSFEEVILPSTLIQLGYNEQTGVDSQTVFGSSYKLKRVVIKGCKNIGNGAFASTPMLAELTLPSNLEFVGKQAFARCKEITEITIPAGTKKVCDNAFSGITALTTVTLSGGTEYGDQVFAVSPSLTTINFPEEACTFGKEVFMKAAKLQTVTLPDWMETVPDGMFLQCNLLDNVTFGAATKTIGQQAFKECKMASFTALPTTVDHVGASAFHNCKMTEITLPAGCTIDQGAFAATWINTINFPTTDDPARFEDVKINFGVDVFSSSSVKSVELPAWMTHIPNGFLRNTGLNYVGFLGDVKEIGDSAFHNCTYLTNVDFPATLSRIGKYSFYKCGADASVPFGKVTISGDVLIDDHAFDFATISEIDFLQCATLGQGCLANQSAITSITFPDCMEVVPAEFCKGWKNLTSVKLSKNTRSIGDKAFYECRELREIEIPESVDSIGTEAFNLTQIETIKLPDHDVWLAEKALKSNDIYVTYYQVIPSPLKKIILSNKQTSIPESCCEGNKNLTTIEWYGSDLDPAAPGLLSIGKKAFLGCTSLEKIVFPDKHLSVGESAFQKCSGAQEIMWPDNDKEVTLWSKAFDACSGLQSVTFPDKLTAIADECFNGCTGLKYIKLGKETTSIGKRSFNASSIETIDWNDKITTIGEYAFANNKIKALHLPDCLKALQYNTFADNTHEIEVDVDGTMVKQIVGTIEEFSIGSSLTAITPYCFQYSISAEEIVIPTTIKKVDVNSFLGCGEQRLTFETTEDGKGISFLGQGAFQNNKNLEYVEIPPTLQPQSWYGHVGILAFSGCSSLKKVVNLCPNFNSNTSTFSGCTSLEEFESKVPVAQLRDNCFKNCNSLTKITLVNEITGYDNNGALQGGVAYGDYCFEGCTSLTNTDFLSTATSIGRYAFKDCTGVRQFIFTPYVAKTTLGMFNGDSNLQSIIWPATKLETVGSNKYGAFALHPEDISGAPLKALSYSYATDIWIPTSFDSTWKKIDDYTPNDKVATTSPDESILIVERGERWKYIANGYGQLFDIREKKQPQIELEGDLRSSFNSDTDENGNVIESMRDNKNHYRANLRWHMPLSDFNMNGPTVVKIYRDAVCIGKVVFSQPVVMKKSDDPDNWKYKDVDKIWHIRVTYENPDGYAEFGEHNEFTGDFINSTADPNKYNIEYVYQDQDIDFEYTTHRRLLQYDRNGYKSWFAFCDTFTSLELDDPYVASSFDYWAEMDGYSYETLENNPDLELRDGSYYHTVVNNPDKLPIESNHLTLYSSIATPRVLFDGFFGLDDIKTDKTEGMAHLSPSKNVMDEKGFRIGYEIDPQLMTQTWEYPEKKNVSGTQWNGNVIDAIVLYEITKDEVGTKLVEVGKKEFSQYNRPASDALTFYNDAPAPRVNSTYVLRTYSSSRGYFGSASITIPGVPTIDPIISSPAQTTHFSDPDTPHHSNVGYHVAIQSQLKYADMGFDNEHPLTADDYYIGLMRRHSSPVFRAEGADQWDINDDSTDLIHHWDGRQTDCDADVCTDCATEIGDNVEHSVSNGPTYHDHVEVPLGTPANLDYLMRVYVKVPDYMLRTSSPTYMLAEANASTFTPIVSGVENVTIDPSAPFNIADFDAAHLRYYDLQGRPLSAPRPGTPCIVVTPAGARKTLLP